MFRRKGLWLAAILMIISCFWGCGKSGVSKESSEEQATAAPAVKTEYNMSIQNWKAFSEVEESDKRFVASEFAEDFFEEPEGKSSFAESFTAASGENYYKIKQYLTEEENFYYYSCYLYILNVGTMETQIIDLDLRKLPEDVITEGFFVGLSEKFRNGHVMVTAIDAYEERLTVFWTVHSERWEIEQYFVTEIKQDGTIEKMVDLTDALQKRTLKKSEMPPSAVSDFKEYYYVIDNIAQEITVVDHMGVQQGVIDCSDCNKMDLITVSGKAPDGTPVFEYRNQDMETTIFSLNNMVRNHLYEGKTERTYLRNLDNYGNVLYLVSNKLLCWNVAEGTCKSLYNIDGLSASQCTGLIKQSEEEIVLVFEDGLETFLYKLIVDEDFVTKEIALLTTREDSYITACAAEYSRKNPGVLITIVKEEKDDVWLNHVAADMQSGKGADIILTNREDMLTLQEGGYLAVLEDVLPQELQEQIFDSVLEYGRVEGLLYGVAYDASLSVMLVSQDIWKKDTWTLQEVLDIFAKREQEGTALEAFSQGASDYPARMILYDLCLRTVEDSSFLDMEEKTCNFETEEFYELLRLCKKLDKSGGRGYMGEDECREEVKSGKALALYNGGGLIQYSGRRADMGEDSHTVGYPSNNENKALVNIYTCLVVNKETEHYEVVKDFLQFILSEECQIEYALNWVRRDVLLSRVEDSVEINGECIPVFRRGYGVTPLGGRADGTSFVEEYVELMDNGKLESAEYAIQSIVVEEAGAYFAGDKTEYEVAAIIQNRIQLYLEEKK